jgi:hypothetical protein
VNNGTVEFYVTSLDVRDETQGYLFYAKESNITNCWLAINYTIPTPTTAPATTTTTVAPMTTPIPTNSTGTPVPTNPPVIKIVSGIATSQVSGIVTLLPPPVVNNSLVLFTSANVTSTLPIAFQSNTTIPKEAIVSQVAVTFNVTYLASSAQVAVILSDEDGNQAGNVTVTINKAGAITVNMKDVLAEAVRLYKQDFTIRAIRGSILKVSLGVVTPDVAINIDPEVKSTVEFATQVTTPPTATSPVTTSRNTFAVEPTAGLSPGAIIGIAVGSVVGAALLLVVAVTVIVVLVVAVVLVRKRRVYVQEKMLYHRDMDIQI